MNDTLSVILKEVTGIQAGLLRFQYKDHQQNLQVKVAPAGERSLHCLVVSDIPVSMKITGKRIHLIQKYRDNYFFIAGYITDEAQDTGRIISIRIIKALWFIRKKQGSVTWLREKHVYENRVRNRAIA